jgi:hypothetical protein
MSNTAKECDDSLCRSFALFRFDSIITGCQLPCKPPGGLTLTPLPGERRPDLQPVQITEMNAEEKDSLPTKGRLRRSIGPGGQVIVAHQEAPS